MLINGLLTTYQDVTVHRTCGREVGDPIPMARIAVISRDDLLVEVARNFDRPCAHIESPILVTVAGRQSVISFREARRVPATFDSASDDLVYEAFILCDFKVS